MKKLTLAARLDSRYLSLSGKHVTAEDLLNDLMVRIQRLEAGLNVYQNSVLRAVSVD